MEVAAFISSIKIASDIAKGIAALKSRVDRDEAVSKILQVLITVQSDVIFMQGEHSALTAKVNDLEKENLRLKDWSAKADYERREIARGIFAYIEKDFVGKLENAYKLCCHCFNKSIESELQQHTEPNLWHTYKLQCPTGCPVLEFAKYTET